MDRIEKFNKMLEQVDHSDPVQVQEMIDLITEWLDDKSNSVELQTHLTALRINLWLDLWELTQNSQDFKNARNYLEISLEGDFLVELHISAIERVFYIFRAFFNTSKDIHILGAVIYWGLNFNIYATLDYPNYFLNINLLATALRDRFVLGAKPQDLDNSISLLKEALELAPEGHKDRPLLMYNLADALRERYALRGNAEDLDKRIEVLEKALAMTPMGDKNRLAWLNNLANALGERDALRGKGADLDKRIKLLEEALKLMPEGDKNHPSMLNNLAVALGDRFALRGKAEDLDKRIEVLENLLLLTQEGDKDCPTRLDNFAIALLECYALRGNAQDLDQSIELIEKALALTPEGDEDRTVALNILANALRVRFMLKGKAEDLDQSIKLFKEALALTSNVDENRPDVLNNLANAYGDRYVYFGNSHDLNNRIRLCKDALKLTSEGDQNKPNRLNNLAIALGDRFSRCGNLEDLDKEITLLEEALALTVNGHRYRPELLSNLGKALGERYVVKGDLQDLSMSIKYCDEALNLTTDVQTDRPKRLNRLAISLINRYARIGNLTDLYRSIKLLGEAYTLTPKGHKDRPACLNNLGTALRYQYSQSGNLDDLCRAIDLHEEALELSPQYGLHRPRRQNNLALALVDRYYRKGNLEDLNQSIDLYEEALAMSPDGDQMRPGILNNMAISFREHFARTKNIEDLEKCIELMEDALLLTSESARDRPILLSSLASVLGDCYTWLGNSECLYKSIELYETALSISPKGDQTRPGILNNLAIELANRYALTKNAKDLEKSIELSIKALELYAKNDPCRSGILNNLACSIADRYFSLAKIKDAEVAAAYYHSAIKSLDDGHIEKPNIQHNLGNFSMRMGDYLTALEAFEGMAASLEMLRSASSSKQDREKLLSDYSHSFANLVFCCLKLNQPEKALRYAEAAKSRALVDALHNQVTDISNLATQDDSLKANLEELHKLQHEINWLLKQLDASDQILGLVDPNASRLRRPPDEINADLKDKRAKEQELWQTLEKRAPVFAMTVSAPPFHLEDAITLADEENAALISYYQHSQGWVAFVVYKSEFFIAELQGVEELLEHYQSAFSNLHSPFGKRLLSCVLEEAWRVLIQPLQGWLPVEGSNLVIAPFAGLHHLPFAAFTNPVDGSYLVDRYHLKAATSLGTLKAMRTQAQIKVEDHTNAHAMTVVGYADDPSSPSYLPAVEDEVNAISNLFNLPHPLIGQAAMIENVLTQAPGSQSLHFACHGMFDPQEPQRSGLMLEDGWLTVRDVLTRMNLSGTELVVMSSCLSGLSRISQGEELTGLLTAFISARAKSVVGSLWSVDDRSTAELMVKFYELISQGWGRSAAMREAQLSIRKQPQWQHPYYWSPFFLTGVG